MDNIEKESEDFVNNQDLTPTEQPADAYLEEEQQQENPTGPIPKPAPSGVEINHEHIEEPLSSDTIAMKRPVPKKEGVKLEKAKRLKIFCYNCEQKLDLSDMEPFSKIACPSCASTIIVPRWFDNYLLEEECGEGGMAKVYRGLDLALDREIAIKILNEDIADDEDRGKLFLHEARTAATLNHYALLPIYTCGQFEEQPYIVMQFMAGGSLDKELNELDPGEQIPVDKVIKWMLDASEGLDNARRHGIVHHDIKPGNFMLDAEGALKVGDFGISQALFDSRSEEIAQLTKLWVSPDYVSPEKVTTGKETYLGDIYSLGATFYHILTGKVPFELDNMDEILKAKTVRDPIEIHKLRDDVPEALSSLIMSMMSRTPEARPSYRDVIAELNSLKKEFKPRRKGKGKKAPMTNTKPKITPKKMRMQPSDVKINKKNNIAGLVIRIVVFLALIIGGFYLWKNGYFDQFLGNNAALSETSGDLLPDVTSQLASGKSRIAAALAETALDSGGLDIAAKKQAALQYAIATYLNGDRDARNKCGLIADSLLANENVERYDPVMAILRYLSAGSIKPANLREQVMGDDELKIVSEVAVFVKEVYNKGDDSVIRSAYRNFSSNKSRIDDEFWGKKSFNIRIKAWYDWLYTGQGSKSDLEPLLVSVKPQNNTGSGNTSRPDNHAVKVPFNKNHTSKGPRKHNPSLSLSSLTPDWLKEHRQFAQSRPRPRDYTFSDSSIQNYVRTLPKKYQKAELERADQITNLKSHLIGTMIRSSYGSTSIMRRNGPPITGTFMANPNYISVKRANGNRVRIKWGDVHFSQFVKFLAHYAKIRSEATPGGQVSRSKQKREAAWEYLRIALLCDWFGQYNDAVRYTRKAVAVDNGIENEAIIYMME